MSTLRLGFEIRNSDKARLVRCKSQGGSTMDVWVPKSISETTREGAVPQRTVVWVPSWFLADKGLREERA